MNLFIIDFTTKNRKTFGLVVKFIISHLSWFGIIQFLYLNIPEEIKVHKKKINNFAWQLILTLMKSKKSI
jgi:hypothetical protein